MKSIRVGVCVLGIFVVVLEAGCHPTSNTMQTNQQQRTQFGYPGEPLPPGWSEKVQAMKDTAGKQLSKGSSAPVQ